MARANYVRSLRGISGEVDESFDVEWRVTLMDGLLCESFWIFLYGMTVALAGFAREIAMKILMRKFWDLL